MATALPRRVTSYFLAGLNPVEQLAELAFGLKGPELSFMGHQMVWITVWAIIADRNEFRQPCPRAVSEIRVMGTEIRARRPSDREAVRFGHWLFQLRRCSTFSSRQSHVKS